MTLGVVTGALRGVASRGDLGVAWEAACSLLANGSPRLRRGSMEMLRRLVELGGFPESRGHHFFTAYLRLLETRPLTPAGAAAYEGELLLLTRCVFRAPASPLLQPLHLSQLFECVCCLAAGGAPLGAEVSQALCFLFSFLLSVAPVYDGAALLRRQRVAEVCGRLLRGVGTGSQAEVRLSSSPLLLLLAGRDVSGVSVCRRVPRRRPEGRGADAGRRRGGGQETLQTCGSRTVCQLWPRPLLRMLTSC